MSETQLIERAAAFLRRKRIGVPDVALVLGSGLSAFAGRLTGSRVVPFARIPGWPGSGVQGHTGNLVLGALGPVRVACLAGRVHLYEGWSPHEVVRAVRTLRHLGVPTFLLTNAAGGIGRGFRAGDLMVIRDHLNLTGQSALLGAHEPALGPRFPDQSHVYPERLRAALHRADRRLREGVYAGLLGPSYETPAEVQMVRCLGGHAVGMSTVLEATALHAMGARVAGLSLITNLAAGISRTPLSHDEVVAAGRHAQERIFRLLAAAIPRLAHRDD